MDDGHGIGIARAGSEVGGSARARCHLVLRPGIEGVIDRELEFELALVVEVEERKPVRDREEARDCGVASRSSATSAPWTTLAMRASAGSDPSPFSVIRTSNEHSPSRWV
jgi:hypothetical protein